MHPTSLFALAGVVSALCASGCTSSTASARTAAEYGPADTTVTPTAVPKAPGKSGPTTTEHLSRGQAASVVRRINLTLPDVPRGFHPVPSRRSAADTRAGARLSRCLGSVSESRALAVGDSPQFRVGSQPMAISLGSSVAVLRSRQEVALDMAAYNSSRMARCVEQQLTSSIGGSLAASGVRLDSLATSPVRVPAVGTTATFGRTYRFRIVGNAGAVPLSVTMVAFATGRTEVQLTVIATGPDLPRADRDRVVAHLLARGLVGAV